MSHHPSPMATPDASALSRATREIRPAAPPRRRDELVVHVIASGLLPLCPAILARRFPVRRSPLFSFFLYFSCLFAENNRGRDATGYKKQSSRGAFNVYRHVMALANKRLVLFGSDSSRDSCPASTVLPFTTPVAMC